jgi:hypothetical protein
MYEAPRITEVGSLKDVTLAEGWDGYDDHLVFMDGHLHLFYGTNHS